MKMWLFGKKATAHSYGDRYTSSFWTSENEVLKTARKAYRHLDPQGLHSLNWLRLQLINDGQYGLAKRIKNIDARNTAANELDELCRAIEQDKLEQQRLKKEADLKKCKTCGHDLPPVQPLPGSIVQNRYHHGLGAVLGPGTLDPRTTVQVMVLDSIYKGELRNWFLVNVTVVHGRFTVLSRETA